MKNLSILFEKRIYTIDIDMPLVCAVETELGAIPALHTKFSGTQWSVAELVSLIHILLQSAGKTIDFMALGNRMMAEGIDKYLAAAQDFAQKVVA